MIRQEISTWNVLLYVGKNISWMAVLLSLFTFTRGRGLTLTSARVLVRAHVDASGFPPPRHSGPHSACNPCSRAHFGHVTAACHRQRDWALSKGSHMQQEMDIFLRRLHILGAPPPSSITVHLRKPRHKKLVIVSPETWLSFVIVTTRVFRPVGRIFHRDHQT